jgi:alanine racemase
VKSAGGPHEPRAAAVLDRLRPLHARIDLDRLAANYAALAALSPVPLLPVVKADAYGHGAATVTRRLEALGAPLVAVAYAEEGAALRQAGVRVPVLVLAGFAPGQVALLHERRLTPVVSAPSMLEALLAAPVDRRPAAVHVKVDTGMARLGFAPAEFVEAARRLADVGVAIEGVLTHLAAADEDAAFTEAQLDRFEAAVAALAAAGLRARHVHAANSAGLAHPRPSLTLARPGLLLYGVPPRPRAPAVAVRPVLSLRARLALVREVATGTPVSYGGRFVAARPSRIAVVPAGYADGVPRTERMREAGGFELHGRRASLAGTVCMDLTLLDVTDVPGAAAGDEVVLLGDSPSAWELADWAGTNAWDVLTRIGSRVPRVYLEHGEVVAVESRYADAVAE